MENRSFEGEPPNGSPPKDPKDKPSFPQKPWKTSRRQTRDQPKESSPLLGRMSDNENESPPAYVRRHMQQEPEMDDLEDLDQPPPEPVPEPQDDYLSQEDFIRQSMRRRRRRLEQYCVEGPRALRADPPNQLPLPPPEPYPYPDLQQPADAADPDQPGANAADPNHPGADAVEPAEQGANAADPDRPGADAAEPVEQGENAADPNQQGADAAEPAEQGANAADPNQQGADAAEQGANVADPNHLGADAAEPVEQEANATARSATWRERWDSFIQVINSFSFQFPFQTLLLTWPLSTAIVGALNLGACFIDGYIFPYLMMAVGVSGTATLLVRLFVTYYEERVSTDRVEIFWLFIRAVEFQIWVGFSFQLYLFFKQNPSFTPGDANYCIKKFYKINCGLMFMTSAVMIGWIVVNVGKLIYRFSRRDSQEEHPQH